VAAVDVPDRVEPAGGNGSRAHARIHLDRAFGLKANRLQADAAYHRIAANAHENLVGLYLSAVIGVNGDGTCRVGTFDARDEPAKAYIDPRVLEGLRHEVTGERLYPGKQALAGHDHGYFLGSERVQCLGHLAGDRAAADHSQPLWHLLDARRLPVG